jgi:hypothetical protein
MEAWERSDLAGVGEGLCAIDMAHPLTQLRLIRCAHKSAQRTPHESGHSLRWGNVHYYKTKPQRP